jgi:hypothetical protein
MIAMVALVVASPALAQSEAAPLDLAGNRTDCMLENAAKVPPSTRYSLSSVNHFTVNRQGKIARMVAFARPRGN